MLRELNKMLGPDYAEKITDDDILTVVDKVAQRVVYTIHTPVKAGHDRFDRSMYTTISHKTLSPDPEPSGQ